MDVKGGLAIRNIEKNLCELAFLLTGLQDNQKSVLAKLRFPKNRTKTQIHCFVTFMEKRGISANDFLAQINTFSSLTVLDENFLRFCSAAVSSFVRHLSSKQVSRIL